MKTLLVSLSQLEEWEDNPGVRHTLSDSELQDSIVKYGIKQPLATIPKNDLYLVVDGNRRVRIAKRLNILKVWINVYDKKEDIHELAIILNCTGRCWNSQAVGQLAAVHQAIMPIVPKRLANKLLGAMRLLGEDFTDFIQQSSLSTYDYGMQLVSYLERRDDKDFCKKAVLWVSKHKMGYIIRVAIMLRISPTEMQMAVENDVPLTITLGKKDDNVETR